MTFDIKDISFDDVDEDEITLDIDQIKTNVPAYSNEKLCEMIVCDRCFSFGQKISIICMEELARRRAGGDTFDFERHIEQITKEMPVLNFGITDIGTILKQ